MTDTHPHMLPLGLPVASTPAANKVEVVKSSATPMFAKQDRFNANWYCNCPASDKVDGEWPPMTGDHPKTCNVWGFDDWVKTRCEWDAKDKKFVYFCKCNVEATGLECKPCKLKKYYLGGCWIPDNDGVGIASYGGGSYTGGSYMGGGGYTQKCRHMEFEVKFPDGTVVLASSAHSQEKPKGIPDFGLYAYDGWHPRSLATMIPWKDFGLPSIAWPIAAGAIKEAHQQAKDGWTVEVGCAGGHGRTGTILACMAVLSQVPAVNAVEWVRDNYCDHAVEGDVQEWWVFWFEAWHLGIQTPQTLPQKPPPPPAPKAPAPAKTTTTKKDKAPVTKTVEAAVADGSAITMDMYADYLTEQAGAGAGSFGEPEHDDAADYIKWQTEVNGGTVSTDEPEDWNSDGAWDSGDPDVEDRWERVWDHIDQMGWEPESDDEFWEKVNLLYDDFLAQDVKLDAAWAEADAATDNGLDVGLPDDDSGEAAPGTEGWLSRMLRRS